MFHSYSLYQHNDDTNTNGRDESRLFHSDAFHPYKFHPEQHSNLPQQHERLMSANAVMDHPSFSSSIGYHRDHHPFEHDMLQNNEMCDDEPMDFFPSNNNATTASNGRPSITHLEEDAADHLLGLLQREANDYSLPLPVKYYPNEFDDMDEDDAEAEKKNKPTMIGPWRKRIASWMYDVVDHFKYDRNVVSIALRYIDQYVSHLLLKKPSSGVGGGSAIVKRRHFQLIAVTSLYLAIKIHGELLEEDEMGELYDVVGSLLAEVDGYGIKGYPKDSADEEEEADDESHESDDEIRVLSNKIKDLRRRHRLGRLQRLGGGSISNTTITSTLHPIPFKPRKRGMLSGPLRLNSFVELSRGLFTARDITDTETKILKALNYVVNPPTSRKFVGELLRILAFSSNGIGNDDDGAALADSMGVDRRELLQEIVTKTCHQTEGASSVPALSIGCLPSMVAYASLLNTIDEVFSKHAGHGRRGSSLEGENITMMEDEDTNSSSYELEDFQRHYRRFSRNQNAPNNASGEVMEKELYLEEWKEQFLMTVFHATNYFLAPDTEDVIRVRELLLDEITPMSTKETNGAAPVASPTEVKTQSSEISSSTKKRSPRSPRSIITGMTSARFRGSSSFFSRSSSIGSNTLCSPYDSSRRTSFTCDNLAGQGFETQLNSTSSRSAFGNSGKRSYFKQTSAPITSEAHHPSHHARTGSFAASFSARASTPDMSQWPINADALTSETSSYNLDWKTDRGTNESWRSEAFQPPPFFSA